MRIDDGLAWVGRDVGEVEAETGKREVEELHQSAACQLGCDQHIAQEANALAGGHRADGV